MSSLSLPHTPLAPLALLLKQFNKFKLNSFRTGNEGDDIGDELFVDDEEDDEDEDEDDDEDDDEQVELLLFPLLAVLLF